MKAFCNGALFFVEVDFGFKFEKHSSNGGHSVLFKNKKLIK